MTINVRIKHKPNPAKPEDPNGIIEIEVNGKEVSLPLKGYDKVLIENPSNFKSHTEQNKDREEI